MAEGNQPTPIAAPSTASQGQPHPVNQKANKGKKVKKVKSSNNGATVGSSPVGAAVAMSSVSSISASLRNSMLVNGMPELPNNSATSVATCINDLKNEVFHLAAATPVPISPIVERQFYESQLLLYVLGKVRGEHKKRQNYHWELDQGETELRRSFVDKLAYICDFKKGGSTVTALALQKTYQGVTFWLGANETIKPKVIEFLQQILELLKNVVSVTRETAETELLALIVPFNENRLDYYWSALEHKLPQCMKRLGELEGSTDFKPSSKDLNSLKSFLGGLPSLSKARVDLVRECFEARKRKCSIFDILAQLTASGSSYNKFFDDIRHLLGRLGEHLKATKTLVSAALRFPAILDEFEIKARASPPARCFFQSSHSITLDGIAGRIFRKEEEISHYQQALETLERTSNGALLCGLQHACLFKTRIHAELLLVDFFYWHQIDFVGDDPYIGCSKPACFNCFQYILAHPGNFVLPACHNKIYLAWRTPDINESKVPLPIVSKIRECITSKMNSNTRAELRRQIDGRCTKRAAQYDSVTGTSSSIQVGHILPSSTSMFEDGDPIHTSAQEDSLSRTESPSPYPDTARSEVDESDDDLSWYKSRIAGIQMIQ